MGLFGKLKPPVTQADKEWLEEAFLWIEKEFGAEFLKTVEIITPTPRYFPGEYQGREEDGEFYFQKVCEYMKVPLMRVSFGYYSEQRQEFQPGQFTSLSPGLTDQFQGSAGLYMKRGNARQRIEVEIGELKDPEGLISTIAHELAHVKLLGEERIHENDEPLTDLVAVAFGFGIFMGNSVFHFSQWQTGEYQGWETRRKGYLPEQMIAYSLALMVNYQGKETVDWEKFLNKSMRQYFRKSLKYIRKYPEEVGFK
ncbi:MAG: hypothetical protein AAFV07_04455 [Bacteroidota bacterium]